MKKISKYDKYKINIYRTKNYIVEQALRFHCLPDGSYVLFSIDTYYLRDSKYDRQYEKLYNGCKDNIDGKRVYAGAYIRKYVY